MQAEMKLIFLDLDGTLLTEEMKITEETKRAFQQYALFRRLNCLHSGRMYRRRR